MATYTIPASVIYKYHVDDQQQNVIDQVITDPSTVISNENGDRRFLFCFDVSTVPSYGKTSSNKMLITLDSYPTGTNTVLIFGYKQRTIPQSGFNVGDIITFGDRHSISTEANYDVTDGGAGSALGYFEASTNDVIYIECRIVPYGSDMEPLSNNEIRFHNLRIQFQTGTDMGFVALSDIGSGYHQHSTDLRITLSSKANNGALRQHKISGGTAYHKLSSAGSYASIAFTGTQVTIPASTFADNEQYDIYIDATSVSGATSSTAAVEITTTDGTAYMTPISPKNEVTNGTVLYRWAYSSNTGAGQYAYDLQYSSDNGSTWNTIRNHVVSSEDSYEFEQVASGQTLWRVRGYNQNDVAGDWSAALSYVNNVPPQPPMIRSITGSGRQTVAWSATAQIAYRITVYDGSDSLVYDTGEVYSTDGTALINQYLQTGSYLFRVKIASAIGGWSDWSEMTKTVSASLPAPVISVTSGATGTVISITPDAAFSHYYILRNGVPIADITETTYTDPFAVGMTEYAVIGVDATDAYGYAIQNLLVTPAHHQIVLEDGTVISVNEKWDAPVLPERSISAKYGTFHFLGEPKPTHQFAQGARTGTFAVSAYDADGIFDQLLGAPVFFASAAGWGGWCIVTALNRAERRFGNEVVIQMEIDSHEQEIMYAV